MKDYSNFIPSSHGFITHYEIVGEEIHVYTVESKKGEPHKYPLTSDWLKHIETRLENQYRLIIENRTIVENLTQKKLVDKYWPTAIILTIISIIGGLILFTVNTYIALFALIGISFIPITVTKQIIDNQIKQLKQEFDSYQVYLEDKQKIEQLSEIDPNITNELNTKTTNILKLNESLIEKAVQENKFNINFMDQASLKELQKLISRYMISKDILEEPKFQEPKPQPKSKPKKKTRSKKNK